jgi:uncharacterized protein (TIGR02246 family)
MPGIPVPDSSAAQARRLYQEILAAWNARDAARYAAQFGESGSIVGFDGSQVEGARAIEAHLRPIFESHPTAAYVAVVREVRVVAPTVVLIRAVAGMIPPGRIDVNPAVNAVQSLVAVQAPEGWRASLFQNTPAAWHGRPDESRRLTEELEGVVRRGLMIG